MVTASPSIGDSTHNGQQTLSESPNRKQEQNLHVVLVEPNIPWNTGNIGRTCLAAGAQLHLVEPLGFSLDAKEVRRSGLDYWAQVRPQVWKDWPSFEGSLGALGEPWFLTAEGGVSLWDVDLTGPTSLVFGGEVAGLPLTLRTRFHDRLVSLPMSQGTVRSLNLSSCAAVCLYEVLRQRSAASLTKPSFLIRP